MTGIHRSRTSVRLLAAATLAMTAVGLPGALALNPAAANTVWVLPESPNQLLADDTNGRLYAVGEHVTRLSLSTGAVAATSTVAVATNIAGPLAVLDASGNGVFVVGDTWIKRLNPTTLAVTATVTLDCPRSPALAGGRVWFVYGCTDGSSLGSFDASATSPTASLDAATVPQYAGLTSGSDPGVLFAYSGGIVQRLVLSGSTATQSAQTIVSTYINGATADPLGDRLLLSGWGPTIVSQTTLQPIAATLYATSLVSVAHNGQAYAWADQQYKDVLVYSRDAKRFPHDAPLAQSLVWLSDGTLLVGGTSDQGTSTVSSIPRADRGATEAVVTTTAPATQGRPYVMTGSLVGPGAGAGGVPTTSGLTLELKRKDGDDFVTVATTTTTSRGAFSFTTTAPERLGRVEYEIDFAGNAQFAPSTSSTTVTMAGVPWDFNADGFADVAVGAPGENVGAISNAGTVTVMYGSAAGVTGTGSQVWTQESDGVPGASETGDQFGYSLSSGDYNGDGFADLAVGSNTEQVGSQRKNGGVTIIFGGPDGLRGAGAKWLDNLRRESNAYNGESLASGDFNGDHYTDLAVGAPGVDSVSIEFGSKDGSWKTNSFNETMSGVPGTTYYGESFGESVASGDFNGDNYDDLAAGIPWDIDGRSFSSGGVVTVYGSSKGITGSGSEKWTLDSTGISGTATTYSTTSTPDLFGLTLAAGDVNGDGKDDVAISAQGETVSSVVDAGAVHVLLGTSSGISATGSRRIAQDTTGVPGTGERADLFGSALAMGTDRAGGKATLAISSAGDQSVTIFPAGAVTGVKAFSQETSGMPDTTETGDLFGEFAQLLDLTGSGFDALVIGAPGENSASGAITVLASSSSGVTATGAVQLTQDSDGIGGASESGDYWGWLNTTG